MSEEYTFICIAGCGVFPLNSMKNPRDPEDPTLVCPNCGCCRWYIVPPKDDPRSIYKNKERESKLSRTLKINKYHNEG